MTRNALILLSTALSLPLLWSCGGDPPGLDETVQDYIAGTGLSFASCGAVRVAQCSTYAPSAADQAVATCLRNAAGSCLAAQARLTTPTKEGDPVPRAILIHRQPDDSCGIVAFTDTRQDRNGPQALTRALCQTLEIDASCGGVLTPGQCLQQQTYR